MEIFDTDRIEVRALYDIEDRRTTGKVYAKCEGYIHVANVKEAGGRMQLEMLAGFEDRKYVSEDLKELNDELIDYANFWHAREDRVAQY